MTSETMNFADCFAQYILYYSPAINFYLDLTLDLSVFIKEFIYEKKFSSSSNLTIRINNPKIIGTMHYIDNFFLEKSSLITNEIELTNIVLNSDYYSLDDRHRSNLRIYFKDHSFSSTLIQNNRNSHSYSDLFIPEEPHSNYSSDNNRIFTTMHVDTKKQINFPQDIISSNLNCLPYSERENSLNLIHNKYDLEFAMKTLLLCHSTKTEYHGKANTLIHDTLLKEHEEILNLCSQLDLQFCGNVKLSENKSTFYKLRLCENIYYYFIVSNNEYTFPRNRFSIILTDNKDIEDVNEFVLLVCSFDLDSFLTNLKATNVEIENLKDTVNSMKEKGMQSMIYATKTLSAEEFKSFLQAKTNLNLEKNNIDNDKLNSLYDSIEQNLEIVLVLNYKKTLKTSVYANITALKDAQIKYFLLSRDCEYSTMTTAYNAGILSKSTITKKFIASDNKSAIVLMKHFLFTLKKELENHKISGLDHSKERVSNSSNNKYPKFFTLILDGTTLDIILKNVFLKENMNFILIWTQNVICFQINAEQKHQFLNYIKSSSLNSNAKTLALGSSYEDFQMFQEADISVEINDQDKWISSGENGFILNDFHSLAHLILVRGPQSYKKIDKIIHLFLFILEMILFLRFFYEFFSCLSLNYLISDEMFHLSGIILTILSIFYFCFSDESKNVAILETFPIIYKSNALKIKYSWMKFILKSLIPSILVAACFLAVLVIFSNEIDQGNARSFTEVEGLLYTGILIITDLQVFNRILFLFFIKNNFFKMIKENCKIFKFFLFERFVSIHNIYHIFCINSGVFFPYEIV